jgi:hypothetical protein
MATSNHDPVLNELRRKYGPFFNDAKLLRLDFKRVPVNLVAYLPYAALWGISDDLEREKLIDQAPEVAKSDLIELIELIDDDLDEWLAGDEAQSTRPSPEYIAFSAMRMAADYL